MAGNPSGNKPMQAHPPISLEDECQANPREARTLRVALLGDVGAMVHGGAVEAQHQASRDVEHLGAHDELSTVLDGASGELVEAQEREGSVLVAMQGADVTPKTSLRQASLAS